MLRVHVHADKLKFLVSIVSEKIVSLLFDGKTHLMDFLSELLEVLVNSIFDCQVVVVNLMLIDFKQLQEISSFVIIRDSNSEKFFLLLMSKLFELFG